LSEAVERRRALLATRSTIRAEPDSPLTVSYLASRSNIQVLSLPYGFRRHFGMSPMAYVREVRLRRHMRHCCSRTFGGHGASIDTQLGVQQPRRYLSVYSAPLSRGARDNVGAAALCAVPAADSGLLIRSPKSRPSFGGAARLPPSHQPLHQMATF